ncbi:MAG: ATP-binding cassette domain-containing protein [Treponemataceae bacterium]|nr:ATP-binding cassette domain-containing protein [Treponemataceae bacterium]
MNRSLFNLSGGQKQKIACASVAVTGNKVVLLDEPSANLDLKTIDELRELLEKWKSEGKTIVVAEHRISYLWGIADRTVILKDGEIVRELSRGDMDRMSEDELHALGLRTNKDFSADCRQGSADAVQTSPGTELSAPYAGQVAADAAQKREGDAPRVEQVSHGAPGGNEHLVMQNFRYKYKNGYVALNIPCMEIPVGKITAITGNNGEGKTTLLNCLCGLSHRAKGTLVYNGKVYRRRARQKLIYLVMQDVNHQLFTESVLDEVLISQPQENEAEARRILAQLDLAEFADRHPQSLSGGQKQRVAVASAIASGRAIMLFDEPTSGLDYTHMLQIGAILRELKKLGKTVIVVTHDRELIKECCDFEIRLSEFNQIEA